MEKIREKNIDQPVEKARTEKTNFTERLKKKIPAEDFWTSMIKASAYLLALVPLIRSFRFFYPYVFPKTIALYFLAEIAIFSYWFIVAGRFFSKRTDEEEDIPLPPCRRNLPITLIGIFLGWLILTTLTSQNFSFSFWGSLNRSGGLLTFLHIGLFFWVIRKTFRRSDWNVFWLINVIIGIGVSFQVLYQHLMSIYPIAYFGNPVYIATYLIYIFFAGWILVVHNENRRIKLVAYSAMTLSFVSILFLLDMRSAQISLILGSFSVPVFFIWIKLPKDWKKIIGGGLAVLAILFSVIAYQSIKNDSLYSWFERARTVRTRVIGWQIAIESIKQKPIFGWGLENFDQAFEVNFNPLYYSRQNDLGMATEKGMDNPHNKLLGLGIVSGIIGSLIYIVIFLTLIKKLIRKHHETKKWEPLVMIGWLTAVIFNSLFIFDMPMTLFLLFLTFAFVIFKTNPNEERPIHAGSSKRPLVRTVSYLILILGFAACVNSFVLIPVKANILGLQAAEALSKHDYAKVTDLIEEQRKTGRCYIEEATILELNEGSETIFTTNSRFSEDEKRFLEKLAEWDEYILAKNPKKLYFEVLLGKVRLMLGKTEARYCSDNVVRLGGAINGGLKRIEAMFIMAQSYQCLGDKAESARWCQKGIDLNPQYGYSYFSYARICVDPDDPVKKMEYLKKAMDNKYINNQVLTLYHDLASDAGNVAEANWAEEKLKEFQFRNNQ